MSREAFEVWFADYLGPLTTKAEKHSMWVQWQAARAAALEEAAEVCRKLAEEGSPDNPEYGSWGEFDDAVQAIRALKEK